MMHRTVLSLLLPLALGISACSWVELTPSGEKARVLGADEVGGCKKVGTTTVSTKEAVANVYRSQEKIAEELEILARNAASDLGGDTVVPVGTPEGGKQTFAVYDCVP